MYSSKVNALVLAAGKGTRMKSDKAKVLHEIFFAPMLHHVLDAIAPLQLHKTVVVTGHQRENVENSVRAYPVDFAYQEKQMGTGHAVLCAEEKLGGMDGVVLILCGDTPLIRAATLRQMIANHFEKDAVVSLMTTVLEDPTNYGRIITDTQENVLRIVEEKDANDEERSVKEINAGIYCVDISFLFKSLKQVGTANKQGEVYLTDIIEIATRGGYLVNRYLCSDPMEVLGVNSRVELAQAHHCLQQRRNQELMMEGVTLLQPESIFIEKKVTIGRDTVVHPNAYITGKTIIGAECVIGPYTVLHDCEIGNNATLPPFSYMVGRD